MLPEDFDYGFQVEPYRSYRPTGLITYYNCFRKDGKPRINPQIEDYARFTHLRKCHFCGKLSTPKHIQIRCFFGGEGTKEWRENGCSWIQGPCCVGCWNKIRPLDKQHHECRRNRTLLNKLKQEIREAANG